MFVFLFQKRAGDVTLTQLMMGSERQFALEQDNKFSVGFMHDCF